MRIGSVNLYRHDNIIRPYTEHYQRGAGILPAFTGTVYQEGNGLGDILKSVFRFMLPIVSSGASTFLKSAAQGLGEGKSLGEAAKVSLAPMAKKLVGKTVRRVVQRGSERRTRAKTKRVYKRIKRRGLKRSRVVSKKRNLKRAKISTTAFLPSNF